MANIYWTGAVSTEWGDFSNWSLDDAGLIPVVDAPWVDNEPAYKTYDLTLAIGATTAPVIGVNIGFQVTGTCDIDGIANQSTVNGGTFTGDGFTNLFGDINDGTFSGSGFSNFNATIYGGTFTGSVSNNGNIYGGTFSQDGFNNNGSIYGGTFSGDGFTHNIGTIYTGTFTGSGFNNYDYINGGTFSGDGFTNGNSIFNGTFSGDGFTNNGSINDGTFSGDGFTNNSAINGGTFEITGFTNSGTIDYQDITVTSGGTPYTGDFLGQVWLDGDWVPQPFGTCYYTNASGDGQWGTLSNWNSAADGSGVNPTDAPWTVVDGSTIGSDLVDATGGAGVTIDSLTILDSVTGTCNIAGVDNSGTINGGTFTGSGFNNSGNVNGGTFLPQAISVTTSGGNTLLSMSGGPTFAYPTPASGGGSDQTIARLLNLPWFINL
jgi:hypothetical protein